MPCRSQCLDVACTSTKPHSVGMCAQETDLSAKHTMRRQTGLTRLQVACPFTTIHHAHDTHISAASLALDTVRMHSCTKLVRKPPRIGQGRLLLWQRHWKTGGSHIFCCSDKLFNCTSSLSSFWQRRSAARLPASAFLRLSSKSLLGGLMAPNGSTEGAAARVSKPGACSVFWSSAFCAAASPALAVVLDLSFAPMTATDAKAEGPDVLTVWAVCAALLWAAALASGAWSTMLVPSCMRGASGLLVLSTAASTVSGVALGMESGLAGLTGCEASAFRSCHSCSEAGLPTLILKPPWL